MTYIEVEISNYVKEIWNIEHKTVFFISCICLNMITLGKYTKYVQTKHKIIFWINTFKKLNVDNFITKNTKACRVMKKKPTEWNVLFQANSSVTSISRDVKSYSMLIL